MTTAIVPAVDQHVAHAHLAHLAEGDFLRIGRHGFSQCVRTRGFLSFWLTTYADGACSFAAAIACSTSSAKASKCCACFANSSRLCRTVVRALINAASAPIGAGFPNGFDSPSSAGVTGFVRIIHLLEETADYGHSVFDLIATEA